MKNMRTVGTALADISLELSRLTDDPMTRELLSANARRLNLGAVRLAVLGNSNAGKSTLINALLRTIAVPESGNTASPIPVWFASGDDVRYSVYTRSEEGEKCDHPDTQAFIKKYCYNLMDITDDKRVRFSDILWASAEVPSEYLKNTGLTLIDTLGINATEADTTKTIATIDSGVDIVMFVTARVDLLESDIRFLRERVLGYGERVVPYPVRPSQLVLVYNDKGMSGASMTQLYNSADKLLEGLPEAEIEAFKHSNIIMLNALAARRERCGAYDYQRFAPEGTLDMEMTGLAANTRKEIEAVSNPSETAKAQARAFDALEDRINGISAEMMTQAGGIVERRILQLEAVMDAIKAQANVSISHLQKEKAAVQQKIDSIKAITKTFTEGNGDIDAVFEQQRRDMRAAIEKTLKASAPAQKALVGELYTLTDPPEYINRKTMRDFYDSTGLERERILEGWIRNVLQKHFLPNASKQFKKLLLEASVQEGNPDFTVKDTVSYQVEQARKLSISQSTRMKSFCEKIVELGAKDIGLSVPTDDTIDAWFAGMASEMETAILEAIAKLQHEAYNKLNAKMPEITRAIRVKGILNRILQFFGNVNGFWQAVRDRAIMPAATLVCREWFDCKPTAGGTNMYTGIDEAYHSVQNLIVASLNRQTMQVEKYLSKLEDELKDWSADVDEAAADASDIEKTLADVQKKLNELRGQMEDRRNS